MIRKFKSKGSYETRTGVIWVSIRSGLKEIVRGAARRMRCVPKLTAKLFTRVIVRPRCYHEPSYQAFRVISLSGFDVEL